MRLSWIQVDGLAFEQHAPQLGRLLGIPAPYALGLLCCMWRWVLARGSDGPASGVVKDDCAVSLIETGAGWDGKPGAFVTEVQRIGLIEPFEGGLRVKGLDRYSKAWIRQEQARARLRKHRLKSV